MHTIDDLPKPTANGQSKITTESEEETRREHGGRRKITKDTEVGYRGCVAFPEGEVIFSEKITQWQIANGQKPILNNHREHRKKSRSSF